MNTISKINRKLSFFVMLALLGSSWLSFTKPAEAAPNAVISTSAQFQTIPVERLLNPDGTLNLSAGGSGTLDLHGWDVTLDSKRGPILTRRSGGSEPLPKQALDPHARSGTVDSAVPLTSIWQALPHYGLDGGVAALAFIGSDLYVGGNFTGTADGVVTNLNDIAKFSGGAWSALPHNGLSRGVSRGVVLALAVSGSDLYVGGDFTQTDDGAITNLNKIAKFSGGVWSALPHNGLNGNVAALAFIGSDLYVGGGFSGTADNAVTNLNSIAKFSVGAWSALPNHGLNTFVHALAVIGSDLYVGGTFTRTEDSAVTNLNRIAKFSGGAWSALPHHGLNFDVYAFAVSGSDLYVGGFFTQTSDGAVTNLNRIAKFSGGAWSALPHNGLNDLYYNPPCTIALTCVVYALAVSESGDLYVGGAFTQTNDGAVTNLNFIARFSGGAWSALPLNGLSSTVKALAVSGSDIYVGGSFDSPADALEPYLVHIAKLSPGFNLFLPLVLR